MERTGEDRVPAGPLAVRWHSWTIDSARAGALTEARLGLENAGSVTWRPDGPSWIYLSYHWLDTLGNPIVWDGLSSPLPHPLAPGERLEATVPVRAPMPPGRYRLAFDLLDAERLWFSELGNPTAELDVDVEPRIRARRLAVEIRPGPERLVAETRDALAGLEEGVVDRGEEPEPEAIAYLAAGCLPAPDWSRRILDAHAEGYAVVGGSVAPIGGFLERRRAAAALAPWAPGRGRVPGFEHPLLCPSVLTELEPSWLPDVEGLPALRPPDDEPWLYDGRIALRPRLRSGRRRG